MIRVALRSRPVAGYYGGNMIELDWDRELENSMMGWLRRACVQNKFGSDEAACRITIHYKTAGQNLFRINRRVESEVEAALVALDAW